MENVRKTFRPRTVPYAVCLTFLAFSALLGTSYVWDRLPIENWLGRLKFLEVKRVHIACGWPLTAAQVGKWLPPIEGRNIFLVQPHRLMALLEQRPWVSAVTIRKAYPDAVDIVIDTKIPRALMLQQSQIVYVDGDGQLIDKVTPAVSRELDLPLISYEKDQNKTWKIDQVISMANELPTHWKNLYKVSQVELEDYPYLKVYLSQPRVEILLSFENWTKVVNEVPSLIQNPPSPVRQVRRINLVFPKKAIVSSSLSN
jgi:hypothetical protein